MNYDFRCIKYTLNEVFGAVVLRMVAFLFQLFARLAAIQSMESVTNLGDASK